MVISTCIERNLRKRYHKGLLRNRNLMLVTTCNIPHLP